MKVLYHRCLPALSNCYMLGTEDDSPSKEALIIDPGCLDEDIITFIEDSKYNLIGVLITHDHAKHTNGLRALSRIYNIKIFAAKQYVLDYKTIMIRDGEKFGLGTFHVEVLSTPGHSVDSVIYKIDNLLFTGDALSGGLMGKTDSSYGAMRQIAMIQNKVFSLPGNYIVLPGHGPPSTLAVERHFNIGIGLFEENRNKNQSKSFSLDLVV